MSQEKEESIIRTYLEVKKYKTTADIEKVTPRYVSKLVKRCRKDGRLARDASQQVIDQDALAAPVGKSELDLQLDANELFENGHTSLAVSKQLRLRPDQVLQFRKAYDELVSSDGDEIGKRIAKKATLESNIQRYQEREMRLKEICKEKRDELQEIQGSRVTLMFLKAENTLLKDTNTLLKEGRGKLLRRLKKYRAILCLEQKPRHTKMGHKSRVRFKLSFGRNKIPRHAARIIVSPREHVSESG